MVCLRSAIPVGFDRSRLTPPAINSVEEFLQFTEEIRAIPHDGLIKDEKGLQDRPPPADVCQATAPSLQRLMSSWRQTTDPKDLFQNPHTSSSRSSAALKGTRARKNRKAFNAYARDAVGQPG